MNKITCNTKVARTQSLNPNAWILLCVFAAFLCLPVHAQDKHVTTTKMLGVGYNVLQDTYLSPEDYSGLELRYQSHTVRQQDSCLWQRLIINEGYISQCRPQSKTGSTIGGAYHFQYGALRHIVTLPVGISIHAGAQAEVLGGFFYNTRNGNNPAQMRASLDIGPMLKADYTLGKFQFMYEASCPLIGLAFSPNYGQSYYELFSEGHYDHNLVPTTIVCTPSFRNQLLVSVSLSRTHWRGTIGYLGDYNQMQVNGLKQHSYTSMFVIGLSRTLNFSANRQ